MSLATNPSNNGYRPKDKDIKELSQALKSLVTLSETRLRLSNVFRSIHHKMNEGIYYEDILDSIFTSLGRIIPFDRLGIALLENHGNIIRLNWVKSRSAEEWVKKGYSEPIKDSILKEVIDTNFPVIINDLKEYLDHHPDAKTIELIIREGMITTLTCPLRVEGEPIGAISFSSSKPHTYIPSHIDLFSEISEGLAIIIEKELLKQSIEHFSTKESIFRSAIHDLNNPLSIIHAILEIAERKPSYKELGEDTKKSFQMLKRNCESMINIIHGLIYEKNKLEIGLSAVDKHALHNFVSELVGDYEALGQTKDIKISADIGPDVPENAKFNYFIVKEVIHNMISNSIKFSPKGKRVMIRVDFNAKESKLFFTVTDEGPGIPIEEHSKLFKQFGKTSVQPTAGEPSSGLGLANAKRLIEGQKGEVFMNSKVGQGSTFGFWIPLSNS